MPHVVFVSSNFKELYNAILYKNNLKRMVRLFPKVYIVNIGTILCLMLFLASFLISGAKLMQFFELRK